jgi:hypothetical protein|tara:strand:- start:643 stop:822 length:180 start_codon:yes stop_codon:yes gene_type:complete
MQLLDLFEKIKNKKSFNTPSGSVFRVFEIYERDGKQMDGTPYVFIKPEVEEKKIKKSLN